MLCLSGFELYPRWVPLYVSRPMVPVFLFVVFARTYPPVKLRLNLTYSIYSLTWLSINQNSLPSSAKNLSVVVKFFWCYSRGCPAILEPRQVCVDIINTDSRVRVPWNDFDFATGFIK